MADLKAVLAPLPAGHSVRLRAVRNHEALELKAVLGPRPVSEPESILAAMDQTLGPALSEREQLEKRRAELGELLHGYYKRPPSRETKEATQELAIELRQIYDRLRELGPPNPGAPSAAAPPKEYPGADFTAERLPRDVSFQVGFAARDLTPQLALILHASGGILISRVQNGSAADRAGLKAGDVIVRAQEAVLSDVAQLQSLLASLRGTIKLRLVRNKQEIAVNLSLP